MAPYGPSKVSKTKPLYIVALITISFHRYRPGDMLPKDVQIRLMDHRVSLKAKSRKTMMDSLRDKYLELRKQIRPVMRHYFTEKHKIPMSWFSMRLNYTRSVATTSIVGHILGLGDRHCSNILLDNVTGEVVHIDLGIAFDQVRGGIFVRYNCEEFNIKCRGGFYR